MIEEQHDGPGAEARGDGLERGTLRSRKPRELGQQAGLRRLDLPAVDRMDRCPRLAGPPGEVLEERTLPGAGNPVNVHDQRAVRTEELIQHGELRLSADETAARLRREALAECFCLFFHSARDPRIEVGSG